MGKGGVGALNKKARIEATRPLAEKKGGETEQKRTSTQKEPGGLVLMSPNKTGGNTQKGAKRRARTEKHVIQKNTDFTWRGWF